MNNSKFVDELTKRINELYKMYEMYIWKGKDRKLVVTFGNNMMLTFYLYDGMELVDEVYLSFEKKEYDLYKLVCLRTFILLLGNVKISKFNDYAYHNLTHKPYLLVVSKDDEITKLLDMLVTRQENEIINLDMDIVENYQKKIKYKVYSKKFLNQFDIRTKLSKEMLKRWE